MMKNMITAKWNPSVFNIAVLFLFLSVLLGLRWGWTELFPTTVHPKAVEGVLDLRNLNLQQTSSIPLNGVWEFLPNQLVTSDEMDRMADHITMVQVPGDWREAFPQSDSSLGYGTYRLRILVDPLERPVSLWLQNIEASSFAEINGFAEVLPGERNIGKPADNAADYIPRRLSYTNTYMEKGMQELVVLIHAANFENPYQGGILQSVRFGSQAAIDTERWYSIGFQLVTFIVLLLHGIYACMLYLLNRKERSLLLFSLLTLAAGLSVVADHDNIFMLWVPLNYEWALKLSLLANLWMAFLFLYFCRSFSTVAKGTKGVAVYTALLTMYSAFLLVAPPGPVHATCSVINLFMLLYLYPFGWSIYAAIRAYLAKKSGEDAIYLLLTAAAIISHVGWSILDDFLPTPTVYYPIDMIAAIVSFSAYWFQKFFRKTQENIKLSYRLQEEDKQKDRFLANTSHELRTPLHGIINIAQSLLERDHEQLNDKSRQDMELLVTISRRMSLLLTDLLEVSQLREHRMKLNLKPLYVQSIVPGVVSMLGYMHENKPIRMIIDIKSSTPAVIADERRLVQILHNLLHNAIKFTEQGTIAITGEQREGKMWIHVSDTGPGMDEETLSRILLPYEQGIHGLNHGNGIGLGLSISQQLVELHGGELTVQSWPGKGSVFSFSLVTSNAESAPVSQTSVREEPFPAPANLVYFAGQAVSRSFDWFNETWRNHTEDSNKIQHRILAVDDDPINLNILETILSTEQYEIVTTNSAEKALELLRTGQWDLLIADVMMPGMSGYDLTRMVREQFSLSELPVLLLTARAQPADIYAGFSAGANDYVTKPVDGVELKYRIRALLGLKQSIHELLTMEAAYLQAQIQPHFIFNTLNSIMALSLIDIEKMRKLGDAFATYLKISFDFLNTKQLVELSHELELLRAYLYVEQERFGERLSIQWEIQEEPRLLLPPLTIQPLVENALKHGLLTELTGGTLLIRGVREEGGFRVEVRDNGQGMEPDLVNRLLHEPSRNKRGIGLYNTNQRISRLYGRGLSIRSRPGEGTSVSFFIPMP